MSFAIVLLYPHHSTHLISDLCVPKWLKISQILPFENHSHMSVCFLPHIASPSQTHILSIPKAVPCTLDWCFHCAQSLASLDHFSCTSKSCSPHESSQHQSFPQAPAFFQCPCQTVGQRHLFTFCFTKIPTLPWDNIHCFLMDWARPLHCPLIFMLLCLCAPHFKWPALHKYTS